MFVLDVHLLRPAHVKFRPKGAAKELQLGTGRQLHLCDEKELRLRAVGSLPKIWLLKSNFLGAATALQFEKFCQIFRPHPTSCIGVFVCVLANRNLKKFQNSFIIYIESERERHSETNLVETENSSLRFLTELKEK